MANGEKVWFDMVALRTRRVMNFSSEGSVWYIALWEDIKNETPLVVALNNHKQTVTYSVPKVLNMGYDSNVPFRMRIHRAVPEPAQSITRIFLPQHGSMKKGIVGKDGSSEGTVGLLYYTTPARATIWSLHTSTLWYIPLICRVDLTAVAIELVERVDSKWLIGLSDRLRKPLVEISESFPRARGDI